MLLVGEWSGLPATDSQSLGSDSIIRCVDRVRACELAMSSGNPQWLMLGTGRDDRHRSSLLRAGLLVSAEVRVVVLGPRDDLAASVRWMRRGIHAYLAADNPIERMLQMLRVSSQLEMIVMDQCFQQSPLRHPLQPVEGFTKRETEVLHCVRLGLQNREIAAELLVSVSTIDYHIGNLLAKLGARNRLEAVRRADALGL